MADIYCEPLAIFPRFFGLPDTNPSGPWEYSSLSFAENIDTIAATGLMTIYPYNTWPGIPYDSGGINSYEL